MQAPGGPAPPALGTHRKDAPLGEQLVLPAHIRNNHDVMTFNKIFASLLAGVFAGIVGITGYQGFIVYLLAHALMGGLLLLKAGLQPQRYFAAPSALLTSGILSQTEVLTFILFWTITNNIVYLF